MRVARRNLRALAGWLRHRLVAVKQLYEHDIRHAYADLIANWTIEYGRALPCVGDSSCGAADSPG